MTANDAGGRRPPRDDLTASPTEQRRRAHELVDAIHDEATEDAIGRDWPVTPAAHRLVSMTRRMIDGLAAAVSFRRGGTKPPALAGAAPRPVVNEPPPGVPLPAPDIDTDRIRGLNRDDLERLVVTLGDLRGFALSELGRYSDEELVGVARSLRPPRDG